MVCACAVHSEKRKCAEAKKTAERDELIGRQRLPGSSTTTGPRSRESRRTLRGPGPGATLASSSSGPTELAFNRRQAVNARALHYFLSDRTPDCWEVSHQPFSFSFLLYCVLDRDHFVTITLQISIIFMARVVKEKRWSSVAKTVPQTKLRSKNSFT